MQSANGGGGGGFEAFQHSAGGSYDGAAVRAGGNFGYAVNRPGSELMSGPGPAAGQPRRHSISLSSMPLRGSSIIGSKPSRSASWAPESPKKRGSGSRRGSHGGGGAAGIVKHFEQSVFNMKAVRSNRRELIGWFVLFATVVVGWKLFSDGGFSAILTLASGFQCFALALLNLKVLGEGSVAGVSERSVALIALSLCSRLISTLFWNGYLPVDRSGDWVYQAADVLAVSLCATLLAFGRTRGRHTLEHQTDKDTCYVAAPTLAALVLSFLVHPTLNQNVIADVSWTFALYMETFAMVPQLWLMAKLRGEVEALTSHYVASMAMSKVFAWIFWYFSFAELAPRTGGRNFAGWAVILSYTAQTVLFIDFGYYYIKALRIGRRLIIDF